MFKLLFYIILSITVGMLTFYASLYQPALVDNFVLGIDVLRFSNVAKQEHQRVEKILSLTIPYEEKQVLINRTIFMQATQEMTKLALGEPNSIISPSPSNSGKVQFIYYLPEDKRPTVLVFEEDKLTSAYKGSALDIH